MTAVQQMRRSLLGLSVGDALGEQFFGVPDEVARDRIHRRVLPPAPWPYTDDTEMAISVVEVLAAHGAIAPDRLAAAFARRYTPSRGYGAGACRLLQRLQEGADWREAAAQMFGGTGSYGNGAAMRVAPVGAFFAGDLTAAGANARRSARVTHTHPEGVAGAIAVARAAALAAGGEGRGGAESFLAGVVAGVPPSQTRQGIVRALEIPVATEPEAVAAELGAGDRASAQDTVPFAIWCAARHLHDYEAAFWATVSGLGDRDTTCAMVGGIVALSTETEIPAAWLQAREPLAYEG